MFIIIYSKVCRLRIRCWFQYNTSIFISIRLYMQLRFRACYVTYAYLTRRVKSTNNIDFFKDLKRISLVCIFQIISYFILIYISFIPYMFLGDASQDVEFFTALLDFQTLQTESTNIEYFNQVFFYIIYYFL